MDHPSERQDEYQEMGNSNGKCKKLKTFLVEEISFCPHFLFVIEDFKMATETYKSINAQTGAAEHLGGRGC